MSMIAANSGLFAAGGNHAPSTPALAAAAAANPALLALTGQQRIIRRQITLTKQSLSGLFSNPVQQPSRRAVDSFKTKLEKHLKEAEETHDSIVKELTGRECSVAFDEQTRRHHYYIQEADDALEVADDYLERRKDEADSVVSQGSRRGADPQELQRRAAARAQRERDRDLARQQAEEAKRQAEETRRQAEQDIHDAEQRILDLLAAEQQDIDSSGDSSPGVPVPPLSPAAQQYILQQRQLNTGATRRPARVTFNGLSSSTPVGPAPDDWIDDYVKGRGATRVRSASSYQSAFKVELPVFPATFLDWFWWIDLFHSLIHCSSADPAEKFAVLKEKVKDTEAKHLVYGLGGGEDYYKEGLRRLKLRYGNRKIIRSAHVQVLESMEFRGVNAAIFLSTAERARTHLFDLSRVGGTCHSDLIERICRKLPKDARIAWNSDSAATGSGLDDRTLNEFGDWLCARAFSDQDAYSVAASKQDRGRQEIRAHQTSTGSGRREERGAGTKRKPFCFHCEGEHRLHDCTSYKELPVRDRVKFCLNHMLCFSCLGSGHSSRDCSFGRGCGVDGCSTKHHRLLHDHDTELIHRPASGFGGEWSGDD